LDLLFSKIKKLVLYELYNDPVQRFMLTKEFKKIAIENKDSCLISQSIENFRFEEKDFENTYILKKDFNFFTSLMTDLSIIIF
jgi:hypothetical protein